MSMNRRTFVKSAGAAGIAAGLTAAASVALADEAEKGFIGLADSGVELGELPVSETRECDVVVVGSGMSGMCSTVAAVDEGLNVVCLEKDAITGGTTAFATGMFGINSQYQKAMGLEADPDVYFKNCVEYHHWTNNVRVARRFVNGAGQNVDWFMNHGVPIYDCRASWSDFPTWHLYGNDSEIFGRGAIDILQAYAEEKGATVLTSTPAVQLLADENGVNGVVAKTAEGSYIQFNCKAVILCSGGYPCNREMVETYSGSHFYVTEHPGDGDNSWFGTDNRTGDGIIMAEAAGADLFRIGAVMADFSAIAGTRVGETNVCRNVLLLAPVLIVNEQAKRFTNEALIDDFVAWGEQMTTQARAFHVCDYDFVVQQSKGILAEGCSECPAGFEYPNALEEIDEWIEGGEMRVYKADTIEELAEKMGVDPVNLKNTVDHYNDLCDAGYDADFCKREDYLIPVRTAPFYGVESHSMYMTTVGGLRIDEHARVLDEAGEWIHGLYAGGCDAGGLYGYSYDGKVACGSQQNFCVASARWAVENIMGAIVNGGDSHTDAATDLVQAF